ncbi:MAG: SMC family ATPase [Gemmatimonadetes bacterium]|nr:SMC family ATPase [Gemmatimonadota bacterium]
MRLSRLRLVNFRQHADNTLLFDRGLTGIIGPNGSGKTTILEAIKWALYGGDATRGTVDSIRFARASARSPVRIELDFELGGHRYRLVRALTTADLFVDGGERPIATGASAVTDVVRRTLGMTLEEFDNTYFTAQKQLAVMATLTAAARAQFLSRVLGYEKLRAAQDLCDERRKALRNEANGMRAGMPDPDALARQLSDAEARLRDAQARAAAAAVEQARAQQELGALHPRWADAQRAREELQGLDAERRVLEAELGGLARTVDRVGGELRHVADAREALVPLAEALVPFHDVGEELTRQRELAVSDGRRQALQEAAHELATELQHLREGRSRLETAPTVEEQLTDEMEQKRRRLDELQGRLELRRTEWVRDRQEAETRRNALRTQYQELRDQKERLKTAGEEGQCPTCSRPLGDHYHRVMEFLETQLEAVSADGLYFRQRLEQLEAMPEDIAALDEERRQAMQEVSALERKLARTQVAVDQLEQLARELGQKEQRYAALDAELAALPGGYDRAHHQALEARFEQLAELSTQANRLTTQVEREPALRRELESAQRAMAAAQGKRSAIDSRLGTIAHSEEEYAALRDEHAQAAAAVQGAALAVLNADTESRLAGSDCDRVAAAQRELAERRERLEQVEAEKRLHDELYRAYSDLRTDLNYQMRPEISELASGFLAALTDARYSELDLDEKYRISILEDGVPLQVISGGEEDLANLVLRLAISQMIAERSGQPFSLLILDEVFGSLDETRRQNVIALLRALRDRFDQVIVITHIDDVRDGLDQVFVIANDEKSGASRIARGDADQPPDAEALLAAAGAVDDGGAA